MKHWAHLSFAAAIVLCATTPAQADYWAWEQPPSWTSSAGASVTAHLIDVQTAFNPSSGEDEVLSFTIGMTGTGVDNDRIQFSLLSPTGEPEYSTFSTDFTSPSVTSFTHIFPDTSGSPDLGQSITNARTSTGDFYVEFTHTSQPGKTAQEFAVLAQMFWGHWSDTNVSLDSSSPGSNRPGLIQRSGTRVVPNLGETVDVLDLAGPDVNGLFLRPGVVFALQSTDEWLTHLESAPGSIIRVGDNGNAIIGDFDDINIILNGDVELGSNAFLTFNSNNTTQIYGDISTDGGGINSDSGIRIGSMDAANDFRDTYYDPFELSLFTDLGDTYNTQQQAQILQQMASEQNQAAQTMSQQQAEHQKTQAQRLNILQETSTKAAEMFRENNLNRTESTQRIHEQWISQLDARSTYNTDLSMFANVLVGGAGDIEQVNINGNVEIDSFAILQFDLAGATPGTEHDVIAINGELALDHFVMLDLYFEDAGGDPWVPETGDSFDLITADAIESVYFYVETPEWDDRFMIAGVVDLEGGGPGRPRRHDRHPRAIDRSPTTRGPGAAHARQASQPHVEVPQDISPCLVALEKTRALP